MQFVAILVLFLACLSLRSVSPLLAVPVGVGSKKPARYPRIQSLFTYSYVNSHGTTVTNHRLSHGWGCSEAAERSVAAPLGLRDSQGVDDNRSPNLYPWYSVIWYSHTLATWTIMNPSQFFLLQVPQIEERLECMLFQTAFEDFLCWNWHITQC